MSNDTKAERSAKFFTITIEGEFDLSSDDIWPDDNGDFPENPTAEDVGALFRRLWSRENAAAHGLIGEWNLQPLDVLVDGRSPWRDVPA